jgi:hypothetical protein
MDEPLVWFTTDLREEAITSLEYAAEVIPAAQLQPWRWKWAVIAVDNALQNLFVLAVAHTSGVNVLRVKPADVQAWREGAGEYPEGKLKSFEQLFEMTQGDAMLKYVHSRPLELSEDEDGLVRWIHRRRNEFVHYRPIGLSVDLTSFTLGLRACTDVARRLILETGAIMWDDPEQDARVRAALASIASTLGRQELPRFGR